VARKAAPPGDTVGGSPSQQIAAPERTPSGSPPDFDPTYPHLTVQRSIRDLLLSALDLASKYETLPGAAKRRREIKRAISEYQKTCDLNEGR
jgi:hypothetical protein